MKNKPTENHIKNGACKVQTDRLWTDSKPAANKG